MQVENIPSYVDYVLEKINYLYTKNPDHVFFDIISVELKTIDDIKAFILEWNKKSDWYVALTFTWDKKVRIFGDKTIIASEVNKTSAFPRRVGVVKKNNEYSTLEVEVWPVHESQGICYLDNKE